MELALEMYASGYDIACFWDNGDGQHAAVPAPEGASAGHMLLDSKAGFRMNPMHLGLELLATAQNQSMLKINTTAPRVHGFASRHEPDGEIRIFLINKFEAQQKLRVVLPAGMHELDTIVSMVDTPDHWGEVTAPRPVARVLCRATSPLCILQAQGMSGIRGLGPSPTLPPWLSST